jgi:cobaltochelatase CobN
MHLLAATPGRTNDGAEAVDLGQSPSAIVILSAADTELACLAQAQGRIHARLGEAAPTLRLANLMQLAHNLSVDLYVEEIIAEASLVVVRLIGGIGYWPYGIEQIAGIAREKNIPLAVIPGDDKPDAELMAQSTIEPEAVQRIWTYLVQGGIENATAMLGYAGTLIGHEAEWTEPAPLLPAGLYWPDLELPNLEDLQALWEPARPVAAIVFYRALVQAGNIKPVDALITALTERGLNALPIFVASLKDATSAELVSSTLARVDTAVILNATGFAVSKPGAARAQTPFDVADCPVLQVIFSGSDRESWEQSTAGLSARDIAMNVALPEVDGRLLSRAVSFKAEAWFDPLTESSIVSYEPVADRITFTAQLAANWVRLRQTKPAERRVALILANYPNKDARIGNGVGLDTPASTIRVLRALRDKGYTVKDAPSDGETLMARLLAGPTNARSERRQTVGGVIYSLADYATHFAALPVQVQTEVTERWGAPENDPFVTEDSFLLPVHEFGEVIVAVQPARGYNIDPKATYHDPALVPPHGYLAFHAWLRRSFDAHAVVHLGKHGNLEWLPGKALALSECCYPEVALGALPNLYPFIVNDPGEGTQAKRRSAAVIIDHLTPPLTRAETYGPLRDLEALVDEYYEAAGLDPRRLIYLSGKILDLINRLRIDLDCGIIETDTENEKLQKLDAYLCELKELQIRDGLHVFGESPEGRLLDDLLVALVRTPRGTGAGAGASLHRALAADLALEDFDPLDCAMAEPWTGTRPDCLAELEPDQSWRSAGDTVERLEILASALVSGARPPASDWLRTIDVLDHLDREIRPATLACGAAETNGLLCGLDGRFVAPGPSGAPSRGRPEVLPTGRNFYSVDTRAVPTPAAWHLGWKAAGLVLDRHRQEHGEWPKRIALSAWGTANMRTGGDDIAQALAFIGARPDWEPSSGRVTGFEILPLSVLERPRVDVTFRISGFFRDAFPYQIDLLDSAFRAVAGLDEPEAMNPLAASVRKDAEAMITSGADRDEAHRRAAFRVFGSKPGAYGAGLQALIDEGIWETDADLAATYLAWGGHAYGDGASGQSEHDLFQTRLTRAEVVLQNQDNREHDVLDSDDYYQFQGGLAASVRHFSGTQPAIYHGDHSRPETPRVRTLAEEVARIVRGRVVNPKWIAGVMRHGYKGAFEMAATVDYLFAFAATARCVGDHHFDAVFEAFLEDPEVLAFLDRHNPNARADIAARLAEAQKRGLWRPGRNTIPGQLAALAERPGASSRPRGL